MDEPMNGVDAAADVDEPMDAGAAEDQEEDWSITGFAEGSYEFQLEKFSKQVAEIPNKQIYSEEFEIAGYSWALLVYPGGNANSRPSPAGGKHMSVYLDCREAPVLPHQLMPRANFTLTVVNHLDPDHNVKKDTAHRFTQKEVDWGFTQFMPLSDALNPDKGFLKNDSITVRVEIKVQLDEKFTGATRQSTGYVGLKNQGATCYMNSLLQTLFHIPLFRQAVYHMPTAEDEDPKSSISLALQSLFFRLQYSKTPVSTKDLIHSFGWNTMDAFQQHDVEELELKLCEKLEQKMKGTKVDKTINRLLMGKFYNYIKCKDVECESTRTEDFLDIQLNIMGCRDVYESFDKIVEVETMEGDNQYHADDFGLQDATKGVLLDSLPPILQLHLKRFDYDRQTWMPIKVNDKYVFYDELDLDKGDHKYLSPNCDKGIRNLYKLYSVLVHSGGSHGGHYYAYIRPDGEQFYKFDDEAVTKEDTAAAIEGQFGGEDDPPVQPLNALGNNMRTKLKNVSNAYMLVYVRVSDWHTVMCEAGAEHLMEHVSKRLKAEQADKERKRREKLQAHRFVTIKVVTDDDIREHVAAEAFDLVKMEELRPTHTLKVPKTDTWQQVAERIEAVTGVPADRQMYWRWAGRANHTCRPFELMTVNPNEAIKMLHRELVKAAPSQQRAFSKATTLQPIEIYLMEGQQSAPAVDNSLLVFLKLYHPQEKKLVYWRSLRLADSTPLHKLAEYIQGTHFPGCAWQDIDLYEEVRTDKLLLEQLDLNLTPASSRAVSGDILIAQLRQTEEEASACEFPAVEQYLQHLHSLRRINFRPLSEPSASGTLLEVPKDADYQTVVRQLAASVGCSDPTLLCLSLHNTYTNAPQVAHVKFNEPFANWSNDKTGSVQIVYYEVLDMPLPQVEQLKTMAVTVVKQSMELFKSLSLRLPKEATIQDLLDMVRKELDPGFGGGRPLRLIKALNGHIYEVCPNDATIVDLNSSYWDLRAEPVPEDDILAENEAGEAARRLTVTHCVAEKNVAQHYGDPLSLLVCPKESLGSVKQRVLKRLKVAPEEFATWRWAVVTSPQTCDPMTDDGIKVLDLWDRVTHGASTTLETCYIGMLHESKSFRRPPRHSTTAGEAQIRLL